ncbi:hypothetical protein FBHYGVHD_CDS0047 [Staphylococcus phage MVC_VPHSA1]|uniref:Uncharacterized protein n=1 Tax=Staphylococcus phage MVC_VPHSA1 TaxID=3088876 RepID=A0ABZ0QYM0_9CAUD|nr:hypothetical protein FBHYGVHD_CDS0047 [Staphylococcus phage MVC_VPHSA1]
MIYLRKQTVSLWIKSLKKLTQKGLKDKARKDFLRDQGYSKQPYGKLKTKYVIHVLDVAAGEIKLLDGTGGIFENIKKIAARKGDPREYDLVINREGTGFQDTEYTVMYEGGDKEIPADVLEKYEQVKVDLVKLKGADFCTPEQAKRVADGAKWDDVLERTSSESSESDVPAGHTEDTPAQEEKPARKDEPVNIDKSEELSDDDLNDISFE